ncbi:unnamed protein product [Urochloa decumbens]|uniref:KIB1-4 beta-propeller domain-containing protein n=1 Tax=Urochloa decumbens TaxID=240449 RepID=A0ABC8VPB9_9POAL
MMVTSNTCSNQEQEVSRWRYLPCDVLGLVLRHLRSSKDRLRLSVVCRDWCASARQHLRRRPRPHAPLATATNPLAPAVPYLAVLNGRLFRFPELTSRLPDEKSTGHAGAASDDWLLFHDDGGGRRLRLTNPFTGKTLLLPTFHGIRAHGGPVEIVNENKPAPSHLLAATRAQLRLRDDGKAMGVRKIKDGRVPGRRLHRRNLRPRAPRQGRALLAGDLLMVPQRRRPVAAVRRPGTLRREALRRHRCRGPPRLRRRRRLRRRHWWGALRLPRRARRRGRTVRSEPIAATVHYLVPSDSSGGELLMVRRRLPYAGEGRSRFAVFCPDLASSRWEAVSRLGRGEALFVGRMCSRAVRGRRYPPGGQIFFLPDEYPDTWQLRTRADHYAAVYGMLDGRVTDLLPRPRQRRDDGPGQATWLFPTASEILHTLQLKCNQQCDPHK